jgi:hypothetical protein
VHNNLDSDGDLYRTHTTTYLVDSFYTDGLEEKTLLTDAEGNKFTGMANTYVLVPAGNVCYLKT